MAVYTVHEPPPRGGEAAADPERFAFVRDGFHVWAFLFAPLWMLWRRLWLVFVLYVVVWLALQAGLWAASAPLTLKIGANLLLAFLVGLEAPTLRRWTLGRGRWLTVGVVVADELELAERRFFDSWDRPRPAAAEPPPTPPLPLHRSAAPQTEVLGLFPQPGVQR
jgi:hypothetical protein